MNHGQAIAKLVRDAGRQLTDPGQALLEPNLLLEVVNRGEIGKQADRSLQSTIVIHHRRYRHPEVGGHVVAARWVELDRTTHDRMEFRQALLNEVSQWRHRAAFELAKHSARLTLIHPQQLPANRVEYLDPSRHIDDQQPRRQIADDLLAESFRGYGPSVGFLLSLSYLRHRRRRVLR